MPEQPDETPLPEKSFIFYIDVFSYCNLRCPSCLVGAHYGALSEWPRGLMSSGVLGRILDKALRECRIEAVGLYNWTEPLLHPEIAALVRAVKSRGLVCSLSSNLNLLREPEALLAAHPDYLRVSVSGFTQEIYARGHREGDIEQVKHNMQRLAACARRSPVKHACRGLLPPLRRQFARAAADGGVRPLARLSFRQHARLCHNR